MVKLKFKFIYEDDETEDALFDFCTDCKKPVIQEDIGDGVYGCEYCKNPNHIEIKNISFKR